MPRGLSGNTGRPARAYQRAASRRDALAGRSTISTTYAAGRLVFSEIHASSAVLGTLMVLPRRNVGSTPEAIHR